MTTIEASADCEGRDDWLWQQDINAWSSLAFLLPAYVAVRWVVVHRASRAFLLAAALAALEALGSVLYHGSGGDLAQALHDLPLIALAGFVAGWHAARWRSGPAPIWAMWAAGAALLVGGAAWLVEPAAVNVVLAVGIAVTVVADVQARRAGHTSPWTAGTLLLLAVAVVTWVLGRDDSPLCDADSLLQWHGAWHVTSAVVIAAWLAHAASISTLGTATPLLRPILDRGLGLLAAALVLAFHHSVAVQGRRPSTKRATLLVVNHGNGFVDPVLVAAILGRLPRFLGKAALWKVLPARPFLALAGVLPVYRTADGDTSADNDRTFEACHHALAEHQVVAIFPEGTTGDRGGLDRVRSGASRIALGAHAGAPDLDIVPLGLAFESRVETRSRAVAWFGEPVDVGAWVRARPHDEDPRERARALTEQVRQSLAAVSPDYRSRDERELLRAIARVSLADGTHQPSFADVEARARRLAATGAATIESLCAGYARHTARLSLLGLDDQELMATRPSARRLIATAILAAVAAPLLLTATLIHLPALALVVLATTSVRATATKGTVRLLVGLIAGLATWITAGVVLADGWSSVLAAAAVAVAGALVLVVATPWWRALRAGWAWFRVRDRRGLLDPVLDGRAHLVTMVETALA